MRVMRRYLFKIFQPRDDGYSRGEAHEFDAEQSAGEWPMRQMREALS